jgi:aspartate/methionine/tyrosine aminotransferase
LQPLAVTYSARTDGFDFHLSLLSGAQLVNVFPEDPNDDEMGPALIAALRRAVTSDGWKGKKIRALVVTNPHNPTGRCYTPDVLADIATFCQDADIHLVVDEVYALSQTQEYASGTPAFMSALSLDLPSMGVDPARVHVLWGTSKDLGSSGFRMVGVLLRCHDPANQGVANRAASSPNPILPFVWPCPW